MKARVIRKGFLNNFLLWKLMIWIIFLLCEDLLNRFPPSPKSSTTCIIPAMKQTLKQTAAAQAAAATSALSEPATA